MGKQSGKSTNTGKKLVVFGFVIIAILFLLYHRYQNPELVTANALDPTQRIAYGFYITLVATFGAIAFGMYRYHKEKVENKGHDLSTIIALSTWNSKSRKIFVVTFIGYGIFFSLASGTLVYQPEVNFSIHYGAEIPSGFIAPCCGSPGYMPKIIIYLTEHIGLQIIPINLLMQVIVSYLVALNATIAINAYTISKKGTGASTIGAATGLFIACPLLQHLELLLLACIDITKKKLKTKDMTYQQLLHYQHGIQSHAKSLLSRLSDTEYSFH